MAFEEQSPKLTLCHGLACQVDESGMRMYFPHAWLEDPIVYIDSETRTSGPKEEMYHAKNIVMETVVRYSQEEALEQYKKTNNTGPWHLFMAPLVCPFVFYPRVREIAQHVGCCEGAKWLDKGKQNA